MINPPNLADMRRFRHALLRRRYVIIDSIEAGVPWRISGMVLDPDYNIRFEASVMPGLWPPVIVSEPTEPRLKARIRRVLRRALRDAGLIG